MVAHLLTLRLLVLKNSLLRSPWQLVAVILGGLYGLGMLALVTVGLLALSAAPPELARTVVVLGGSGTVLGWIIIPLVASGVDHTLDPARLVSFPIPLNRLLIGLTVCGILGIPGVITLLAVLSTTATWWQHPFAAAAALVCAIVAVLTCVVGSRMVAAVSTGLSSGRRFREISGIIAFIPLVLLGPIFASFSLGLRTASAALPGFADALSWTPLGAIWAVPAEVALGRHVEAALHFVIGLVTLLVLALAWKASLARALVKPAHTASRQATRGRLGFFRLFPGTPAGAVAARSLTYWIRDPRYARQLIVVPLVPVLMFFYSSTTHSPGLLNATGPIVALLLSLSIFTDISYDNTAFVTHLSAGIRGVADRAGRVGALATFAVPVVLALTIASAWASASWQILPGLLGLSLGILLSGLGLSSVTSARVVIPVPAPGDSPFTSRPGAGFTSMLTTFATWGILAGLALPELVLSIAGFLTGQPVLGWIALVVGTALGSVFLAAGIRVGGAALDRRAPELFAQLQRQK